MKEEQYLIDRVGKQNPFRVPDGYFDTLASEVMARIDAQEERKPKAKSVLLRPVLYAAASVCALVISAAVYFSFDGSGTARPVQQTASVQQAEDSFDEAADYAMIDNQDIYACLSSDY